MAIFTGSMILWSAWRYQDAFVCLQVLEVVRDRHNISSWMHLPAQSGNSEVLERMRRGYTREAYLDLVAHIRETIPDVALTSDFIAGFCGETEEQFLDTLSLFDEVPYSMAFLFVYSMREVRGHLRAKLNQIVTNLKFVLRVMKFG